MDARLQREDHLRSVVRTVRSVLAERWPRQDFDVRLVKRAMWARLDIRWDDGPTRLAVQQLVEATVAAVGTVGDALAVETHTRRTLTEAGVAAALRVVVEQPPASWLEPDGTVAWLRFAVPESAALVERFTLPQLPVSAHHLAAMLADRIDLSVALDNGRRWR